MTGRRICSISVAMSRSDRSTASSAVSIFSGTTGGGSSEPFFPGGIAAVRSVLIARSKNTAASLHCAAASAPGRSERARQVRPRSTKRLPFCVKAAIAMSSAGDDSRNASIDFSAWSSNPLRASVSAAVRLRLTSAEPLRKSSRRRVSAEHSADAEAWSITHSITSGMSRSCSRSSRARVVISEAVSLRTSAGCSEATTSSGARKERVCMTELVAVSGGGLSFPTPPHSQTAVARRQTLGAPCANLGRTAPGRSPGPLSASAWGP